LVHADLRHRPRRRLAVALAGTAQEQPHLPAGANLRRQARRGVRSAGKAAVNSSLRTRIGEPAMRGRVFRQFLEDLANGDPVAWIILGVFAAIAAILCVVIFFIRRAKIREEEEWKERKRKRGY